MTNNPQYPSRSRTVHLVVVLVVLALGACASSRPEPGSLSAVKQSQFMPLYQQCLRENAPLRAVRTSAAMLNETAKACMKAANAAVR